VARYGNSAYITTAISGGSLDISHTAIDTAGTFSFDAFGFRPASKEDTFATMQLTQFRVETANAPEVPPSIVTQPQSQSVTAGQTASFSVVAAGTAPLTFQWYFGANEITDATNSTLQVVNAQAGDSGNYSVLVQNTVGSTSSVDAVLTVLPPAPEIVTGPSSTNVNENEDVTFTVIATGENLSYQWYFEATPINAATDSSVTLFNVTVNDAGNYLVTVSNAGGSVTSAPALLVVNTEGNQAPANILLSNDSVTENEPSDTAVATIRRWWSNAIWETASVVAPSTESVEPAACTVKPARSNCDASSAAS
jgi:hypothetical protein